MTFGAQMSNPQVDIDMVQTLQAKNPMAVAFAKTHKPMSATDAEGWSQIEAAPTVTHWPRDRSDTGTDVAVTYVGGVDYELNANTMDEPIGPLLKGSPTGGGKPLPAVAFSAKDYGGDATNDLSPTLRSMGHVESHANGGGQIAVAFGGDIARSLTARHDSSPCADRGMDIVAVAQPVAFDSYNLCETGEITQTIKSPQGGVTESVGAVRTAMQVRRLTPVECERLQGFPDGYTNIPWRKAAESPDGPRYKALGNSMAVPVMNWIGQRIQKVSEL
jgi:hypothetical protein